MFKGPLRYAAILAFGIALILTGIGGWSNMLGKALVITTTSSGGVAECSGSNRAVITEQHAWNDGLFMMMVAIFLLLLSMV
jgi:hypothetical protein